MHKYIDADVLKRRVYEHRLYFTGQDDDVMTMNDIIDEMPATDVELVRRGRWIFEPTTGNELKLTCSVCGKTIYTNFLRNYCGQCGAKMDGGSEECL